MARLPGRFPPNDEQVPQTMSRHQSPSTLLQPLQSSVAEFPRFWTVHAAVADTSALIADLMSSLQHRQNSPVVTAMKIGALRVFITDRVWAEVPRKIQQLGDSGRINADVAEHLWWTDYVPFLHVIDTSSLPQSAAADRLEMRDASDAPTARLHDLLAPVVAFATDADLLDYSIGCQEWRVSSRAGAKIAAAGGSAYMGSVLAIGLGEGVVATVNAMGFARELWFQVLVVAVIVLLIATRSRWEPVVRRRALETWEYRDEVLEIARVVADEVNRAYIAWDNSKTGQRGPTDTHRVAQLLAVRGPMSRSEIVEGLIPGAPERRKRQARAELLDLLIACSAFVEIRRHYWQAGRAAVDFGRCQYAALPQQEPEQEDVG